MSVIYNPFEFNPIPRLFNYGKGEFEKYQGTSGLCHEMSYKDFVMNMCPHVHWIVFSSQMEDQGDRMALGIDAEENIYLSVYKYGSCEASDPIRYCASKDDVLAVFKDIRSGIVKASTFEEISEFIESKFMSNYNLTVDWLWFLGKVNEKFPRKLRVSLNHVAPEKIRLFNKDHVTTLNDFIEVATTFYKMFPHYNLLEMAIYPQWLHAYLLMTGADELSLKVLENHKQKFRSYSFQFDFEKFRNSMLAVRFADILNECPDVVLAISSSDAIEYQIHLANTDAIDNELFEHIKKVIYEKLNLSKFNFNDTHSSSVADPKQEFRFMKTDDFGELERFTTTYSIRKHKYLELSSTEIESLKDNDDILYVRKQEDLPGYDEKIKVEKMRRRPLKKRSFSSMKFVVGDKVQFTCNERTVVGVVHIADFGGSLEHDYHSYDIYSLADNVLYKHIPEADCEFVESAGVKIVINRCFGRFGLSSLGLEYYYGLKGYKNFFYYVRLWDKEKEAFVQYERVDSNTGERDLYISTKDLGLTITDEELSHTDDVNYFLYDFDISRTDADLIQTVEDLGEKANADGASLEVVEIPKGVNWTMEAYDGLEWVAEVHRTWGRDS